MAMCRGGLPTRHEVPYGPTFLFLDTKEGFSVMVDACAKDEAVEEFVCKLVKDIIRVGGRLRNQNERFIISGLLKGMA